MKKIRRSNYDWILEWIYGCELQSLIYPNGEPHVAVREVHKCVAMPVNVIIIIIIIICKCAELYDVVAVPNAMSCVNDADVPTNYAAHSGMVKIN